MKQPVIKGQKGFAIVNIIAGVILTLAGFFLIEELGGAGFGILAIGILLWSVGALMLHTLKRCVEDTSLLNRRKRLNTIAFIVSSVVLGGSVLLSVIGPRL